jgi:hypothetical protein
VTVCLDQIAGLMENVFLALGPESGTDLRIGGIFSLELRMSEYLNDWSCHTKVDS